MPRTLPTGFPSPPKTQVPPDLPTGNGIVVHWADDRDEFIPDTEPEELDL